MSDHVAVMQGGVFVEAATPKELYLRPRSAFTATFLGDTNSIAGKVVGRAASDGLWQVETAHGPVVCPSHQLPTVQARTASGRRGWPKGPSSLPSGHRERTSFQGALRQWYSLGIDQASIAVGEQGSRSRATPFAAFKTATRFVQFLPRGVY